MISLFYDNYKVNIVQYINTHGNTSYILRFYRAKVVTLDWEDSDGVCIPAACRIKDLVPGFNWSRVRRFVNKAVRYGK